MRHVKDLIIAGGLLLVLVLFGSIYRLHYPTKVSASRPPCCECCRCEACGCWVKGNK